MSEVKKKHSVKLYEKKNNLKSTIEFVLCEGVSHNQSHTSSELRLIE